MDLPLGALQTLFMGAVVFLLALAASFTILIF